MLKLINTGTTVLTPNQVIPLNVKLQTNNKAIFNSTTNQIAIKKAGYYNIDANFTITASEVGDITIQLYSNGVAIPEAKSVFSFEAVGDIRTFTINDVEKLIPTLTPTYEQLTFVVSGACTMNNANVRIEEVK